MVRLTELLQQRAQSLLDEVVPENLACTEFVVLFLHGYLLSACVWILPAARLLRL